MGVQTVSLINQKVKWTEECDKELKDSTWTANNSDHSLHLWETL